MTEPKLTFFEALNIVEHRYNIVTDIDMKPHYWDSFFKIIDEIPDEIINKELKKGEL